MAIRALVQPFTLQSTFPLKIRKQHENTKNVSPSCFQVRIRFRFAKHFLPFFPTSDIRSKQENPFVEAQRPPNLESVAAIRINFANTQYFPGEHILALLYTSIALINIRVTL